MGMLRIYAWFKKIIEEKVMFKRWGWGAWVSQSVKHPTSAQVTILWFMGLSPVSGSVLIAQSLELLPILCLPLSLLLPCSRSFSLSLKSK